MDSTINRLETSDRRGVKLTCIHDRRVWGTANRTVLTIGPDGSTEQLGRLPGRGICPEALPYHLQVTPPWSSLVERVVGYFPSTNVWPVTDRILLATADGQLFRSPDGGISWTHSLSLPSSSGTMGVLPTGLTVHDGVVYLGEYPLADDTTPRLRRSADGGRSWTTVVELDTVRHVHSVQYDPVSDAIWVTTGDSATASWFGRLRDGAVEQVGGGHQRWRAVSLVFTPDAVFWGIDSAHVQPKLLRLDRAAIESPNPEPTTLYEAAGPVYYGTGFRVAGTRWIAFSTAIEPTADSTAPSKDPANYSRLAEVVVASERTGYQDWHRIASYERRRAVADLPGIQSVVPRAAAYVFLAAEDGQGLFVNPFNTARDHGEIHHYTPAFFERLVDRRTETTATNE